MFLLDKDRWSILADNSAKDYKGKITSYILDKSENINLLKNKIQSQYNMPITEIANSNSLVEDFVKAFRDGEYIITDSFHGLCIALIFHKKVI